MDKRTIYSRFKSIADRYPDFPAVIEDDRILSFAQLDEMVDSILARFGDNRQNCVGIIMHHGAEQRVMDSNVDVEEFASAMNCHLLIIHRDIVPI